MGDIFDSGPACSADLPTKAELLLCSPARPESDSISGAAREGRPDLAASDDLEWSVAQKRRDGVRERQAAELVEMGGGSCGTS